MKCPRCYALFAPGDTHCVTCGGSAAVALRAGQGIGAQTPGWAYLFAVMCGLIPVVALGGIIPMALGFGGAGSCLALSRMTSVPLILRILGCIGITIASWFLFGILFVAVVAATHK
jgi:hypothetical protein